MPAGMYVSTAGPAIEKDRALETWVVVNLAREKILGFGVVVYGLSILLWLHSDPPKGDFIYRPGLLGFESLNCKRAIILSWQSGETGGRVVLRFD